MEEFDLRNDGTPVVLSGGGGSASGGVVTSEPSSPPILGIAYHENLNVILVGTEDGLLHVVDPTLRDVVYSTPITTPTSNLFVEEGSSWNFGVIGLDKVVVVQGNLVGIRSEYNGILLLASVLQTPAKGARDKVSIELNKSEAESLSSSLSTLLEGTNFDQEVASALKSLLGKITPSAATSGGGGGGSPLLSAKQDKWNTVKLELPHYLVKRLMTALVNELVKKNRYIPQLSIASSILERLNMLAPPPLPSAVLEITPASTDPPPPPVEKSVDKSQMFSESQRLATFYNWPHSDYKWALPDKMAQAGFYHNPTATGGGEDRALCFSCNVCLVSWESTDEPWSEHERHSPFCPFVRGEHTANVPLSLSFATAPVSKVMKGVTTGVPSLGAPILGRSSCPAATLVGYTNGLVVVWEIIKRAKPLVEMQVNPKDIMSADQLSSYCDVQLKPKEAWVMDTSETPLAADNSAITTNQISQLVKDSLEANVASGERVVLSSLALLGFPQSSSFSGNKAVPPSVVVGGCLLRGKNISTPFLIVYDLGSNAIHLSVNPEDSAKPGDDYKSGNTGTKQECTMPFDEDAFSSYISEAELLSDCGVSIFSDLNMSDSGSGPGAFMGLPAQKLEGSSTPSPPKSETKPALPSKTKSGPGKEDEKKTVLGPLILQHVTLPGDSELGKRTGLIVQHLLPTPEGTELIVILGAKEEDVYSSSPFGAIISYPITHDAKSIRVGKEWSCLQKLSSRQDLVLGACFVPPPDSDSAGDEAATGLTSSPSSCTLLATALQGGGVKLWRLSDLNLVNVIKSPGTEARITALSYVSSLERLCCGTSSGTLEFYPVHSSNSDVIDVLEEREGRSSVSPVTKPSAPAPATKSSPLESVTSKSESLHLSLDDPSLMVNQNYNLSSLKGLLNLTQFENMKPSFSANVSSCWQKVIQAQKERKHPQHLQHNENEFNGATLTWKLQRNKISRKEHIFEITLPKSTRVGHLDLKFLLQPGCVAAYLPSIEVTLYRALATNTQSNNKESSSSVDKKIDFGVSSATKGGAATPPTNEFLASISAEVVCGPLDLGSHVDLSGTGGTVVLTSPSLLLRRGRNFYLHIQAKNLGKLEESPQLFRAPATPTTSASNTNLSTKKMSVLQPSHKDKHICVGHKSKLGSTGGINYYKPGSKSSSWAKLEADSLSVEFLQPHFGPVSNLPICPTSHHYTTQPGLKCIPLAPSGAGDSGTGAEGDENKRRDYTGCDWLSEVSITIRQVKPTPSHPAEDFERKALLTSESVFRRLLQIGVVGESSGEENSCHASQSAALDLLIWIGAVNLCGPPMSGMSYQIKFLRAVEDSLQVLVMQGILLSDRSTAHKYAKLLVLCIEASENYYSRDEINFSASLLSTLLSLVGYVVSSASSGCLQWYFLLLNRVRGENLGGSSESLLSLLRDVSAELVSRRDPLHSLLRTRFGLYGTPFEPELFELEIPPVTKSYSSPLTYAGLYGAETLGSAGSGTFHLWGMKDVDFRDLLVGNPLSIKWSKMGSLAPKQQIQGLLEVEPLHFTCHAASDGTRIEKIDLGITSPFSSLPLPSPYSEHMAPGTYEIPIGLQSQTNLQTGEGSKKSELQPDNHQHMIMLQKALKMDGSDVMFDYIDNLKFMGMDSHSPASGPGWMVELPPHSNSELMAALAQHPHGPHLTMVMSGGGSGLPPSLVSSLAAAGGTTSLTSLASMYTPMFQPGGGVPIMTPHPHPHAHYLQSNVGQSHGPSLLPPPGPPKSKSTGSLSSSTTSIPPKLAPKLENKTPAVAGSSTAPPPAAAASSSSSSGDNNDGLGLLLSPWQQMMYVPPQQAIVIDRMHSGARRFLVLDFGAPILLTDMIIPACSDLVSLSIDIWTQREDTDGQRLIVASDIGNKTLVVSDLQPAAICRYLKITVIGRYGMGSTKCRIPLGLFYGHTALLPNDIPSPIGGEVRNLSPVNATTHLAVLSHLLEDIGCRYQLACAKLRRLLEPLLKPEISAIDHISYYLPKGKERNKLGLNSSSDQTILCAYQECITLQQQLNVAKNVVKRLVKSTTPPHCSEGKVFESLQEISTDKVHLLSEFLIETLLGISFLASNAPILGPNNVVMSLPYSMYSSMSQEVCEGLFRNICVLENGQVQLSTCMLMLRVCGFQSWWGSFLASTLKSLFSSGSNLLFPQDRVFILLVYLGQKSLLSWQKNSRVLESALELLLQVLAPVENTTGFLSSKLDMTLLGWVIMYLCLCLDGVHCSLDSSSKDKKGSSCSSSRWDFIQGESALYRKISGPSKQPTEYSGFRRRIQKKMLQTKQKLEELDTVASGLSAQQQPPVGLGMQLSALGNKIEAIKQKQAFIGKNIKLQSSKHFKDLLQMRRSEMMLKRGGGGGSREPVIKEDSSPLTDISLNLDPKLCLEVAKNLSLLLLRMDSTCHSDIFLITCKSLAQIATSCRPPIALGAIFTPPGLISLLLNAVGSDFIRQKNWSSPWISHAVMCLIQDILEGEKLFPSKRGGGGSKTSETDTTSHPQDIMSGVEEQERPTAPVPPPNNEDGLDLTTMDEDIALAMAMDVVDAEMSAEMASELTGEDSESGGGANHPTSVPMDICSLSGGSEDDSDIDEISVHFALPGTIQEHTHSLPSAVLEDSEGAPVLKKINNYSAATTNSQLPKRLSPCCATSLSTALDARLEVGVESTTEIRLRMMAVVDSELLNQSLKAPITVPEQVLKSSAAGSRRTSSEDIPLPRDSSSSSTTLLSDCFEKIFGMMASENCSISIEKVLQLWISINVELGGAGESQMMSDQELKPLIPLSRASVSSLMSAFTKNSGIGVQEWGLAFQTLVLVANQRSLSSPHGMWLTILSDPCFPEMILRFISGTGMHLQKNHIVSAGPTVCQHFYNFLLRLRHLSADTPWTSCLKEILLRVLSLFLSGPFLNTDFPLDAFNKFLDRIQTPDLSYVSPATIISIMQQLAQILHQYIFCPNKLKVKSGGEMKSLHSTCSSSTSSKEDNKPAKPQSFDHVMFRLMSFMASFVSLPYKTTSTSETTVQEFLSQMSKSFQLTETENVLVHYVAKCGENQPKTIADIVLQMESTMMRILSVLANPNNINVLVSGDLLSAFNIMETSVPSTVVDAVIHLFCKLQTSVSQPGWLIEPIVKFLGKTAYDDFCCPFIVSETFVLMVLKVISSEDNLRQFVELKCVEAVCDKFVVSSRRFFSSCPSFLSILTQYIGRTDTNALFGGSKKLNSEPIEIQEGQINVAPLGIITSTNFSAHPSDVLLQSTPPHRRARTPVWSYHFFPEETYLELVITLPCAILLKEVHIVPHMTSLSTCPSAVMVEVSRDQSNTTLPMGPPLNCSGMSNIIIQLQPEIATTILLRLFKPHDSNNLGLSQIRLLGSTTFSEAALQGLSALDSVKSFESSAHWLYILDRAVQVSKSNNSDGSLCRRIVETAVSIPDVLESCYSMLIAPVGNGKAQDIYLPHVTSVLFQFGNLRHDVSKQLMDALLGPVQMGLHGMVATNPGSTGSSGLSQLSTVVELLYKLCVDIPTWGLSNLMVMVGWLENCADNAGNVKCSVATPSYFQVIAASLWQIASIAKTDLSEICTPKLIWKLYKWSLKLDGKSELKTALDHVICSICYSKPQLFLYMMSLMGLVKPSLESLSAASQQQPPPIEELIYSWWEEEESSIWTRLSLETDLASITSSLSPSKLLTLARASQSPMAARLLGASGFLPLLNSAILGFWSYFTLKWTHPMEGGSGSGIISSDFLISILSFYGELCSINDLKTWFGENGSGWWLPLLNLLSSLPASLKATFFGSSNMYELEGVIIQFLAKCCWSHPANQKIIATCLREIILTQKSSPHKAVFLHSMSSFCRRLLIQLLLENEKVVVHIKNGSKYPLKSPPHSLQLKDKHPCMGVGGDALFHMSTHSSAGELMGLVEPQGVKLEKLAVAAAEPNRFLSLLRKEQGGLAEAGLEMIDQMTMAMQSGNAAKDKRTPSATPTGPEAVKRPIKMAAKKLKPESAPGLLDLKINGDGDKGKGPVLVLELEEFPDVPIPGNMSLSTLMAAVRVQKPDAFLDTLVFSIRPSSGHLLESSSARTPGVLRVPPLPSTVEVFSMLGGLGLLAAHLPIVYPETLRQIAGGSRFPPGSVGVVMNSMSMLDKDSPGVSMGDWVKIEAAGEDDFYDDMLDSMVASTPLAKRAPGLRQIAVTPGIPSHSMAAFGLFLSLPRFSEILLGERVGAQCMLRLVMGVTDDADGNDIFNSAVAKSLPTLPFQVLTHLLDVLPRDGEEGRKLRKVMVDVHATHFILACLAIFTHQPCDPILVPGLQHELVIAATKAQSGYTDGKAGAATTTTTHQTTHKSDDKSHLYWAKGTGFGTGSTAQSWDLEMAQKKTQNEEENVTVLLHLLSSYIYPKISRKNPGSGSIQLEEEVQTQPSTLPDVLIDLLRTSALFISIAGYLRNDSVLDMSRHVPLYKAILEFLRSLVSSPQLLPLLAPWERKSFKSGSGDDQCISVLLTKMKEVVDNYSKRLTSNLKGKGKNQKTAVKLLEELDDEGLAVLIPDIQMTATLVENAVAELVKKRNPQDIEMATDASSLSLVPPPTKTLEERYIEDMKKLQFAFYEMIAEEDESSTGGGIRFTVPYHYESNVRTSWSRSSASRLKRLAQESVTLSSSLPIAYGSTIFVRSDNDRLDVMKVLITGPSATPYANGCFEFDVFFPNDYPQSPMLINLETNGRQRVRFNPNLYTDGKVCLSILNTWHGRPEEKWNPQTSSLLPVLVAIQSLILNAEPYFNEPGYEKSRGTEQGERNHQEYNVGIKIATLEWAMLDQLRHPSPCFKDIIQRHFWMKRGEILSQLDEWMEDIVTVCRNDKRAGKSVTGAADPVTVYKNNLNHLKKEFLKMTPPPGLEGLVDLFPAELGGAGTCGSSPPTATPSSSFAAVAEPPSAPISEPSANVSGAGTAEGLKPTGGSGPGEQDEDEKMSVDL